MTLRLGFCLFLLAGIVIAVPGAEWKHGVVASGHPAATEAGLRVLKQGGNAVDAAVAVGLTLGVVDAHNSGIGGGCFMLIRLPDGKCVAIDGRETAPGRATNNMFVRNGKADPELSQTGALAAGVPGELAAFELALQRCGRKTLKELILPAADLAARGFTLDASYAHALREAAPELKRFAASKALFFKDDTVLTQGDLFRQSDLAASYYSIAQQGIDWFYRGPFAQATAKWMSENGGLLTTEDFEKYQPLEREPLRTTYRGFDIVGFPPPSSGGVHVAQIPTILEHLDLKTSPSDRLHYLAGAMKLAFADRAHWLGDPDFTKVPLGLVAKGYAAELAAQIKVDTNIVVKEHGTPPGWDKEFFKQHTTHFSVADAEGNWVACTATVNTTFGCKVVVPGTGIVLNNQMDDFASQPGVSNYFGLVGSDANAVAPGKRPLSSMSPTIVLRKDQPVLALGGAGGPRIISQVVAELVYMLDLGMTPAEAIAAPRIHHQWRPDELVVDADLPTELKLDLTRTGYKVRSSSEMGISHIVARRPSTGVFFGAADPRGHGTVAGW